MLRCCAAAQLRRDQLDFEAWRARLDERFPRSPHALTMVEAERWADLFGDQEGLEHIGLQNAVTPEARARLNQKLGRPADAIAAWREAAAVAPSAWDCVSRLASAITIAAQLGLPMMDEVKQVDALRAEILDWPRVGLGRNTTEAVYEFAAAVEDPTSGRALFEIAQRWRAGLTSFSLVRLQTARRPGDRLASADEQKLLDQAIAAEQTRIAGLRQR